MVQLSLINTLEMFNIHLHPKNKKQSLSYLKEYPEICFALEMLSVLLFQNCSYSTVPYFYNNRYTMEFSLTVLSYKLEVLLLFLFPSEDRIYTDSRRIKPNSRSSLLSEQLNPSKRLHLEDEKSRPFFLFILE